MRIRTSLTAVLAHLALVPAAFAVTTFDSPPTSPAPPIAGEPVAARIVMPIACVIPAVAVVRTGQVIELRYALPELDCAVEPTPTPRSIALGTLEAGAYDLRIVAVTDPSSPQIEDEAIVDVSPSPCDDPISWPPGSDAGAPRLCLNGGRFAVTAEWTTRTGGHGFGFPVPLTRESGAFWFFDDENLELMVKVLDGCALNGKWWVFTAGLTDVHVVLRVHDLTTGAERSYDRPLGALFTPIADVDAFPCAAP
jgi:hypothetical protein